MGTNYYWYEKGPCECCGRSDYGRHIGKSSGGWCFALHVYPDDGIWKLLDWEDKWETGVIFDEYGRELSKGEMLQVITERERELPWEDKPYGYESWQEFHARNQSEKGPNGLLRHRLDDRFAIAHGPGTWDLLIGEFS